MGDDKNSEHLAEPTIDLEVIEEGQGEIEDPAPKGAVSEPDGYLAIMKPSPPPSTDVIAGGPLQQYMADVGRYPLLSQEEEKRLAIRYREDGDVNAAYTLVVSNLRLVVKIAYEFRRNFTNLMDLIQEGNIGLMRAVEKFDPYRGVKLSSYGAWWIRAYIIRYLLNNWSLVKIGTTQNQRRLFFNLKKAKRELEAQGFRPEPKLIAARLNVKEHEVVEMEKRLTGGGDLSLDAPLDDDSDSARVDFVADEQSGADEEVADRQFRQLVRERFDAFRRTLQPRDRAVFDRRLVAEDPVTLRELGEEFGVSRERVRQLEADLKKRLKRFLAEKGDIGDVFVD